MIPNKKEERSSKELYISTRIIHLVNSLGFFADGSMLRLPCEEVKKCGKWLSDECE